MGLFEDDNSVLIGPWTVGVRGQSGAVHATWTLTVDGVALDQAAAAGNFTLRGSLPDGTLLQAEVFQSLLGPTKVAIIHHEQEVARFTGFVA